MAALTAELGQFVSALAVHAVPAEAQSVVKTGFTDCFGVMIAGAREHVVPLVDRELAGKDGSELASLIPSGEHRNVEDAALVNAVAAHVLDYDDVTLDGHPSAVLVPAILAQGEALGSSGAEMVTAYAAGYEVWAELLVREPAPLHQKGWHPTTVRGTVAAAAACAKLRELGPEASCDCAGDRSLHGRRPCGQFRLSDKILPGGPRGAIRRHRRAVGASRTDGFPRCARASVGLSCGVLAGREP